ncbi:MAG: cupin domain-containing protein [Gammaproteobacteria bacterium]
MSSRIASLLVLSMFLPSVAGAQDASGDLALASSFEDAQLEWGPCPAFIPKGCEIAVLHGDPANDNADVFFKMPADFYIPSHWHTSAERMVLVSGQLQVTYDGQEPVTLKPGMYAYGPAKVPHKAYCAKGDPCVLFIAFESPVDAFPTQNQLK